MNIHFTYDASCGGYALKMTGMRNKYDWDKLKLFVGSLKGVIAGHDRDYDPVSHIWFIAPQHFKTVKTLIDLQFRASEAFIVEAPEVDAGSPTVTFHSSEGDLQTFCSLLYLDVNMAKKWSYDEALKAYRKGALKLHPDRNGGDGSAMSSLNEVWTRLKNSTTKDFWKETVVSN